MNLNTKQNNFNLIDLNFDLKEIESTESNVWEYHKEDNIVNLFNQIKQRKEFIENLFEVYLNSNKKYSSIIEEIKNKYPEVLTVDFSNNYQKIIDNFQKLSFILEKQFDKLNLSENLINYVKREEILNGNKIKENESEFTSTISKFLNLLKSKNNINDENKNIDNNIQLNSKNNEDEKLKKDLNIQKEVNDNILIENNQNKTFEIPEEKGEVDVNIQIPEKKNETQENKPVNEFKNIDIFENLHQNKKNNNNNTKLKEDNNQEKEIKPEIPKENKIDLIKEKGEVDVEIQIPKKESEIQDKSYFTIKKKEESSEEIEEIIEKYFAYQDSTELNEDEKKDILEQSLKSNSAIKYAKVLLKLKKENQLEQVEFLSKQLFVKALTSLSQYQIEPTKYSMSQSWAIWDIAKQFYYLEHKDESNSNYNIENPIESENKQQEIVDRHIGWVVYSLMTTGKLDNFLNKIQSSIYGKRIIDYMISKPNDKKSLASYKLSNLGKNIRLGFESQ